MENVPEFIQNPIGNILCRNTVYRIIPLELEHEAMSVSITSNNSFSNFKFRYGGDEK